MATLASQNSLGVGDTMDVLMQELNKVREGFGENALCSLLRGIRDIVHYNLMNPVPPSLTRREKECLRWVSEGKTSKDIGMLLFVSEETIISHISQSMKKLGAHTRSEATTKAIRWGLI